MVLSVLVMFLFGLVMLVVGAEMLVRGGSHIALALKVPILMIGLTLVAFGTSTPELSVSVTAALQESTEMALGNVNGSNIANIALVLGLAALVTPLKVDSRLMRRELPALLALQLSVPFFAWDGLISRFDGCLLLAGGVAYNIWLVVDVLKGRFVPSDDDEIDRDVNLKVDLFLVFGGLAILLFGAEIFVDASVRIATFYGLSDRVIGVTVVAVGTSMPEVATALVSAYRGEVDLAIGNSFGSNILNIALVLGLTAVIAPIGVTGPGVWSDMSVAVFLSAALIPIFLRGAGIMGRLEGGVMLLIYLCYTGQTLLNA